jgi:hypothetical protein
VQKDTPAAELAAAAAVSAAADFFLFTSMSIRAPRKERKTEGKGGEIRRKPLLYAGAAAPPSLGL